MRGASSIASAIMVCAACGFAQSGIEVPAIGVIVDSFGSLRSIQGIAGNFWLGAPIAPGVISSACSEQFYLAKTDSKILSSTGAATAPAGAAIFSLDGDAALVYFEEAHAFALWRDDLLTPLDWMAEGEVLSVLLRDGNIQIAVRQGGGVMIINPDGTQIDSVAGATGPVLLLAEGILFARTDEIVLRRPDATEISFELAGANRIEAMGPHYAAIRAGGATYLLRTDKGREGLFLLPGMTP